MIRIFLVGLLIFAVLPALSSDEVYRDAGAGAFSFLKIDPGARAAALGGTGVINSGSLAGFTNPALLASLETGAIAAGHNQWLGDASQNYLAWNFLAGPVTCALGGRFLHVGNLEMRNEATSEPLDTFSAWDMSFHAAGAVRLGIFDLGAGFKILREKIWLESSSGVAFDAGLVIHPMTNLDIAAAVQHIGPSVIMVDNEFRLPSTWRAGARYTFGLPIGLLALSGEIRKPLDNSFSAGSGLEYTPKRWLSLRFGMRFFDDSRDLTAGMGLSAGGWILDYAFVPVNYAMGTVHRFSLQRSL